MPRGRESVQDAEEVHVEVEAQQDPHSHERLASQDESGKTGRGWGSIKIKQGDTYRFQGLLLDLVVITSLQILARRFFLFLPIKDLIL